MGGKYYYGYMNKRPEIIPNSPNIHVSLGLSWEDWLNFILISQKWS